MRTTLFLFFFYIEELLAFAVPAWVDGLRSGEERFKLVNGTSIMFRQVGEDCDKARELLERDIEREYNGLVNYTTEMVFEDDIGCAITSSVGANPKRAKKSKRNLAIELGKQAIEFAYTGYSYKKFNNLVKHDSPMITDYDISSSCRRFFFSYHYTVHGPVVVCFKEGVIIGLCVPNDDKCFKK